MLLSGRPNVPVGANYYSFLMSNTIKSQAGSVLEQLLYGQQVIDSKTPKASPKASTVSLGQASEL